jgi:hypothetical protein
MKDLPLSPSRNSTEVNRLLSELVLVSWLAQQKHERRRLLIASLESLLDSNPAQPANSGKTAVPWASGRRVGR